MVADGLGWKDDKNQAHLIRQKKDPMVTLGKVSIQKKAKSETG
jgi:hypothetical protein